jgi:hypothetical protein
MKPKLKWLLTQDELRQAANCYLSDEYLKLDCDHCPTGHYCQDIGYEYIKKLLEYLRDVALTTEEAYRSPPSIIILMLKQLNKEFGK